MKLLRFLVTFLIGIVICLPKTSADSEIINLSLEESIILALNNNRTIEQSKESRENAKWVLSRTRRATGATFSWTAAANKLGGRDYETRSKTSSTNYEFGFDNTLKFNYPLYTGGKNENSIKSARYGLNSADLNLENSKQKIKYDTTSAYYEILRCKDIIDTRQETVNNLMEHLKQVEVKFANGVVAHADVLSSKVQLANAQQSLITAQNDYDNAIATLNNLIGLPMDTVIIAKDEIPYQKSDLKLEDCLNYAFEHRPDIFVADYAVKQAETNIESAKANRKPQVNAVVSKTFNGESPFTDKHNESWTAGLSMTWNLFDNNVTAAQVHENEATVKRLQSAANQTRESVELDVRKAYNSLKAAEKQIATTKIAVSQAEEDYNIAQIKYAEGVGINLEVMDAQEKLTEARMNYFTALYNYKKSKAQLEKAMGVPVDIDALLYVQAEQKNKSADEALNASAIERETEILEVELNPAPTPFTSE